MRLDFSIVSLPGNGINLTDYIFLEPSQLFFTASNWSTQVVLLVDGTSESSLLALHSVIMTLVGGLGAWCGSGSPEGQFRQKGSILLAGPSQHRYGRMGPERHPSRACQLPV